MESNLPKLLEAAIIATAEAKEAQTVADNALSAHNNAAGIAKSKLDAADRAVTELKRATRFADLWSLDGKMYRSVGSGISGSRSVIEEVKFFQIERPTEVEQLDKALEEGALSNDP